MANSERFQQVLVLLLFSLKILQASIREFKSSLSTLVNNIFVMQQWFSLVSLRYLWFDTCNPVCGCFDPSFMRNCMEPISYIQWTFRLFSLPTSLASSDLKSSTLMTSTCKQNRNINHLSLFKEKLCFRVFLFKWWVNWRCDTSLKEDATFEFAFALGLNLNLNTKMWHRKHDDDDGLF